MIKRCNIKRTGLISLTLLLVLSANAAPMASETFNYFDETALVGGTANGGSGWSGGWEPVSGGGMEVFNNRI